MFSSLREFVRTRITASVILAIVVVIGGYFIFFRQSPMYQFVAVERGSITESVSLTGNTIPLQSVTLSFSSSGNVSRVYSDLGKQVYAGQVLAELTLNDLLAQLHDAQAGLTIAEQRASASKNNVTHVIAEQDAIVSGAYATLLSDGLAAVPSSESYTAAPPAITGVYSGKEGTYKIIFSHDDQLSSDVHYLRTFNLEKTGPVTVLDSEPTPLGTHGLFISFPDNLGEYDDTIWYLTIPNTKSVSYLSNYNAYQKALKTRDTAVANAQASVGIADSSSVADAEVARARAGVESAAAKIRNAQIIAPISGTITQFDAKVGQFAPLNTFLISILSNTGYEVDGDLSETDVGKVSVGDAATMTLDAFPGETFAGSVLYIAPAETNTQGVVSYQVKISFYTPDPRLKSGLTANIDIQTNHKDNVLVLPQYAILQNDQGTFVKVLENNTTKQIPVTLGIQDQNGNVEVLSGVAEDEQVLNIGLKAQ